ncbi:uncharacterized protein LOC107035483 isoform X2 [Diachasma alloeum]|uniref:uncharacterized protein LOC107035483 isoform X2 n=1 Tax=Diachasma alloeum TaxID=454923 RepID=UPI000738301B|nr:uncharacterized protein LOC107035483 isoform X2 [Diachasma alloeum]
MNSQLICRKSINEFICEIIKEHEPDVEILQMNEEPGTGRGDNYTSMLYRLRLNGRKRLKSGDCVPWETAIIYKVLPESQAHREYYKSELLFRNEVAFYNHVWPAFEELQKDGRGVFGGVAKVFIAQSDLIAMEDLKRKGYVMADRRKGLGIDRLKLVLKALAGFHALSLTLRDLRMCELASTRGPLTVFCHGDCWTNNFLFCDQLASNAEPVYLVDFQLTRVGSLALDLVNLLYLCTSAEVRRTQMTSLLRHYHSNLMSALNTLNTGNEDKDSSVMWDLLNDEMRRCARFGLGLAIDMIPITTCDSNQAPDLYEGECDGNEEGHGIRAPPLGGTQCARLMTDLVLEFIHESAL